MERTKKGGTTRTSFRGTFLRSLLLYTLFESLALLSLAFVFFQKLKFEFIRNRQGDVGRDNVLSIRTYLLELIELIIRLVLGFVRTRLFRKKDLLELLKLLERLERRDFCQNLCELFIHLGFV